MCRSHLIFDAKQKRPHPTEVLSPRLVLATNMEKKVSNKNIKQIKLQLLNNNISYHTSSIWCKWHRASRMGTYFLICLLQSILFWCFGSFAKSIGRPNIVDHRIPIVILDPNRSFIQAIDDICGTYYWHSFISSSCQLLVQGNSSFIFPYFTNNCFIFFGEGIFFLSNTYAN